MQDRAAHVVEAQLFTRQVRPESFRKYTIVAENHVAIATRDVELIRSEPQSLGRYRRIPQLLFLPPAGSERSTVIGVYVWLRLCTHAVA